MTALVNLRTANAFAVLFGLVMLLAATQARAATVERVVSPGGIEAWLVQDHLNPIITVNFAFRGGAALDPKGKGGLASMAASLLDEGAGDLDSKSLRQVLDDLSITMRFNTGRDQFGGRLKTLTEHRDRAFGLLADALTRPRFDPEPVERLRAQTLAKLRRDAEDPDAIAGKALMAELYPDHPYGRPSDGTRASVSHLTQTDLQKFVAGRLALDNLAIGVAGNITPEELGPLLDKTFGGLPKKAKPWTIPKVEPKADGRTVVIDKTIGQSNVLFAQTGIAREDKDFYTAYVLNHVLGGGGFTSRLYTEVREKRGLAYSVYAYLNPLDASALYIGGAGTANARVAETLDVVRGEWRRMAEQGLTEQELDAAKSYLTGSFPLRFTSTDRIASMLVGMQIDELGMDYLDKRNSYIDAVTLEDVRRVAGNLLNPKNLTFIVVGRPEGLSTK